MGSAVLRFLPLTIMPLLPRAALQFFGEGMSRPWLYADRDAVQ
jgi:hypothetical protein